MFEIVMRRKREEMSRLEETLVGLRDEHQRRQMQLDEHAYSQMCSMSELEHFKAQLTQKYQTWVRKMAEEAKVDFDAVESTVGAFKAGKSRIRSASKRHNRSSMSDSAGKFVVNEDDEDSDLEAGMENSFDTDEER